MQDHFLIDDQDPLQRGVGVDRMGNRRKDGLSFIWRWNKTKGDGRPRGANSRRERIPCQVCQAELPRMGSVDSCITLEVIFWHTEYEAVLRLMDDRTISKMGFKSRLAAQHEAEKFPERLARALKKSVKAAEA